MEIQKMNLLIESSAAINSPIDLKRKYERLLEHRNMTFEIKDLDKPIKDLHINWFDYLDRNGIVGRTPKDFKADLAKVKPHEAELFSALKEFLHYNDLNAAHAFDFYLGDDSPTYSVFLDFKVKDLHSAENLIREAIKMHDKVYAFMKKQISKFLK